VQGHSATQSKASKQGTDWKPGRRIKPGPGHWRIIRFSAQ